MAKRNRTGNWSKEEKNTLLELVGERREAIESKSCGNSFLKAKQKMWEEVHLLFEAEHGGERELRKLKEQWKRMKLAAKKSVCQNRKHQLGTGGGPSSACVPSGEDILIMEMLPQQFEKDQSAFDDDAEEEEIREENGMVFAELGDYPDPVAEKSIASIIMSIDDGGDIASSKEANISPAAEQSIASIIMSIDDGGDIASSKEANISPAAEQRTPRIMGKRRGKGQMSTYEEAIFQLNKKKILLSMEMTKKNMEYQEEMHKINAKNAEEIHKINIQNAEEIHQINLLNSKNKNKEELLLLQMQKMYWREKLNSIKE